MAARSTQGVAVPGDASAVCGLGGERGPWPGHMAGLRLEWRRGRGGLGTRLGRPGVWARGRLLRGCLDASALASALAGPHSLGPRGAPRPTGARRPHPRVLRCGQSRARCLRGGSRDALLATTPERRKHLRHSPVLANVPLDPLPRRLRPRCLRHRLRLHLRATLGGRRRGGGCAGAGEKEADQGRYWRRSTTRLGQVVSVAEGLPIEWWRLLGEPRWLERQSVRAWCFPFGSLRWCITGLSLMNGSCTGCSGGGVVDGGWHMGSRKAIY
mmetsp:Transcript_82493/g.267224  ORF Transcript_82493/g.267224 Transcript_82493/m.267224 type:complete len:270 (-) Transcript_82493:17-826(-)